MVEPRHMAQAAAAVAAVALMAQPAAAAISLCRDPVIGSLVAGPNITVWGQDTMVAFGSGYRAIQGAKPGIEGPWVAPLITGLVMFLEAWFIAYKGWVSKKTPCLLYWLLAFYPFATGLVEFARVNFDASRYGFLTATWHNLPEYVILAHLFLTSEKARKAFPYILVWVWFLDVFIMFVPSLDGVQKGLFFGGLVEQLTGICCDHLLIYTFGYLWWTTKKETDASLKLAYWYGVVGAFMHMLEIVPLVILLTGLVHRPYIPICILVAFTSPITFYFYGLMADELINDAHEPFNKKQDIAKPASTRLLVVGIILGLLTILGPVKLVPACDVEQRPFVEDVPAPTAQYCPSASASPAASRAAVPADAFATAAASAPSRGYASYVQNTYTQGRKLYDIPGAGQVYASSLPVLADLDWQIIQSKIEPSHAMVPIYSDAPILIWVVAGKMSALITEGNGFSQGVQQLGTGDVLALKKGMIYALENSGTTTLQTVTFINTAPSVGKFKGTQVLFPLFGPQGPLASLTSDMSASAFNTTTSEIDALRRKYSGLPLIFKVTNGPRYVSDVPATSGYTLNMDTELAEHGLNSPGAGGVSVGNNTVDNWAILTDLGFTPVNAYIRKGSLLATHTHVGSVEIDVITKGISEVQLVTPSGELVTNQVVGPGDVFVIPPGYSHVHRTPCSPEGDHAFVAIQSDLRFHTFFVSGAISVFKPFVAPEDAAALSHQSKVGFTHDYKCVI